MAKNTLNTMKKVLLCVALLAGAVCSANAQDKTLSFGVRAGLNINSLSYSGSQTELDLKSRAGFHAGAVLDWNFASDFYLQPGVFFTTRGAKSEFSEPEFNYSLTQKINASYLQIPVVVSYRLPVGQSLKIDFHAGPYFAFGLGGKVKFEENDGGEVTKWDYKVFKKSTDEQENGDIKPFDMGLRFGAGVHIQKFYVGLEYDLGLSNIARTGDMYQWDNNDKLRNGSFAITVGYNF